MLNKYIWVFYVLFVLVSCKGTISEQERNAYEVYGDSTISADNAISASAALDQLGTHDSLNTKLQGIIKECCQKKGCWVTLDAGNNREIFVKFYDYSFFLPMNSAGRTALMEGVLYRELLSVEDLRHYAHDEGKSKEEIEAITEPEESFSFLATGVILK